MLASRQARACPRSTRRRRGRASSWRSRTFRRSGRCSTTRTRHRSTGLVHSHESRHGRGARQAAVASRSAGSCSTSLSTTSSSARTTRKLIGSARDGGRGVVVHLDVGRTIAELPLPGLPHLGSGISWDRGGRRVMATPHLQEGAVSVVDLETWQVVKRIATLGPGFFMRSHENSPYVWVDVLLRPAAATPCTSSTSSRSRSCERCARRRARPLRTSSSPATAGTPWSASGKRTARSSSTTPLTLQEVKRLPMSKPSGKYNVWNKISREEGTSH